MAALRQKPQGFILFKFTQTNRALCSINQTLTRFELTDGDGVDYSRREADGADVPDGMIQNRALFFIQKVMLVMGLRRWGIGEANPSTAAGVETGVDGIAEDEEEGEGEKGDGGGNQVGEFVRRFNGGSGIDMISVWWSDWNIDIIAVIAAFFEAIGRARIGKVIAAVFAEFLVVIVVLGEKLSGGEEIHGGFEEKRS